jgi:hypothetical protein
MGFHCPTDEPLTTPTGSHWVNIVFFHPKRSQYRFLFLFKRCQYRSFSFYNRCYSDSNRVYFDLFFFQSKSIPILKFIEV